MFENTVMMIQMDFSWDVISREKISEVKWGLAESHMTEQNVLESGRVL